MSAVGQKKDFEQSARTAWGDAMPEWIAALARVATARSLKSAADSIGCSAALVSNVLANKYKARLDRVEIKVRGALMDETVKCPVLGDNMARDWCLHQQSMPNTGASPARARLYRKCRGINTPICEHSRIKRGE